MNLQNRKVVITGANGALGKATLNRALELGARVEAIDIAFNQEASEGVVQHSANLLDQEATAALFGKIGAVDAVFNIAGGFAMGAASHDSCDDQWDAMFAINVNTLRNVIKAVIPGMISAGAGKVVNVGALGALQGQADMSAYTASKSTVMRLTESLSAELKHQGINVNAVLPSMIDTPANRQGMPDADYSQWVAPQDLANVICFLGSDAARAVHGVLMPVAGLL
jgi:NAD(P)-dependent dehydrogenase (short-subunit alcohol dehydrogenase family)